MLFNSVQAARELAHEERMARLIPSDGVGKAYPAYEAPRYSVEECPRVFVKEETERVRLVAGDGKTMRPTHDEDGFLLEGE